MPPNRAVVVHGAGDLRCEEVLDTEPGPGEVAIDVHYGGICGSDVHYYRRGGVGDSQLQEPLVLGHEVSGRVAALGPGAAGRLRIGDAVAIHPATPCRVWPQRPDLPANLADSVRYLGSAALLPHTQGAFRDRVLVRSEQAVVLPRGMDLRRAALAEPLAVAIHAIRRGVGAPSGAFSRVLVGTSVAVVGAGPIGALVVAAARAAGSDRVLAADLSPRALALAEAVGADAVLDVDGLDPMAASARLKGLGARLGMDERGPDLVIESSGSLPGLTTALRVARPGGTVVALGLLPAGDLPLPVNLLLTREITLLGSFRFVDEIAEAVELLAAGLPVGPVISHELAAADAEQALQIAADPLRSSKVLLRFAAASEGAAALPAHRTARVVVLGLMGAGKSTLAAALGERTGRAVRDSDRDLADDTGRSAAQIADVDGAARLHELERDHLIGALSGPPSVIAAAASAVEHQDVLEALADAFVVWLRASSDGDPLLGTVADVIIDATATTEEQVQHVMTALADLA